MGTISNNELLQNTNPYYHSAFSLIYRKDSGLTVTSIEDDALREMKLGAIAGTPPVTLLAQRGLLDKLKPYALVVDPRFEPPPRDLGPDAAEGVIALGGLWGPVAGYSPTPEKLPP